MECRKAQQILRITRELATPVPLERLLHKIVQAAVNLTETQTAGILLYDEKTAELRFKVVSLHEEQLFDTPVPVEHSIAGAAFSSGEPVIVPDARVDPRYFPGIEKLTGLVAHSLLAVPLTFRERGIGVLEVENKRDQSPFDEDDVICLTTLAAQAAIAIENARLVTSLEERVAERGTALNAALEQQQALAALHQASAALTSTLNYEEVLDRILVQIGALVSYDAANVMLVEGNIARVFRGRGYERFGVATTIKQIELEVTKVRGLAIMRETLQPLTISDVRTSDAWVYSRPEQHWIRSYIGVPVHLRGRLLGYLSVLSATPGFYTPDDAARLEALGQQAAIAIDNAYLYQQAQLEIEERQRAERELQQHHEHLEELVIARTADLQRAMQQLEQEIIEREQLIADLKAFSHTVAHDLKNPLTIMLGYSSLLVEQFSETQSPELSSAEILLNTSDKMSHIIDELLMFANVRQAEVKLTPLDMATIIAEVETRLAHLVTTKAARLSKRSDWPVALGYPAWVEEVWVNLVSNALKYGGRPDQGIPPHVELGYTLLGAEVPVSGTGGAAPTLTQSLHSTIQNPKPRIAFWVRDNGPGISPQAQARLFTPFTRLDALRIEGHGLGLSIVKRMVEKLGGQVGIESTVGESACFFFTLPAFRAPEAVEPSAERAFATLGERLAAVCTAEDLEQLANACASGDCARLETIAVKLQQQDAGLGLTLLQLTRDFDYAGLEAVLQRAAICKDPS
ncbi:MAG: GAF domain-containing sensor histidine kinase [Anaerolineae bacterium]|jgi:signal transduction histidine kinase|nr:GAF domain-containing sensor histidine kinase [Anaerolineae bacterium]